MGAEKFLGLVPHRTFDDRLMLAWIACALVSHLAHVGGVAQQGVGRAAREGLLTGAGAVTGNSQFGAEAIAVQLLLEQTHAAQITAALENKPDRRSLGFDHCQLAFAHLIAERDQTAHPHAFALGGGNLVANALACNLALEAGQVTLRKGPILKTRWVRLTPTHSRLDIVRHGVSAIIQRIRAKSVAEETPMPSGILNCPTCHKPMKPRGVGYYCPDGLDPPHLNTFCESLMKEGIDGRQDEEAVSRTCSLTDLAIELGRKDSLACVLGWYEALEKKGVRGELAISLDFSRANAIAGGRYGTNWQWEQAPLAREIFYLRRAVSHPEFAQISKDLRCKCLNNLGNRLRVAGRAIEALEYWRRALEVEPNFGMPLCNRAIVLAEYAQALEHIEEKSLFWFVAHKEASAALAPAALYTDVRRDDRTRRRIKTLKGQIESALNLKAITATGIDPLTRQDTDSTQEERDYRQWCLVNYLYLNPLNDLGPYDVAATDSKGLGGHAVPIDAPHIFESFFDQMKQEYVSVRWLLYEGLTVKVPHFSDRDVLLGLTEPRPSLSLAIEKVKIAYRIAYSLFDKIGFFMNAYMKLGIPEKQVSFRTLWRPGENKPIRKEFELTGNWGFCALYWLAKDFFEKDNDEVAEPQARGLSDIRNHIEHKYLRVTAAESSPTATPEDLAFMVSREQFQLKAMHLLKLARSALIYLAIGIGFEEMRREPSRAGEPVEELPPTPDLPDDEKI
jgi:hypothetical protein